MPRWFLAGAISAVFLAACSDARRPTVRGGATEAEAPSTDTPESEATADRAPHRTQFPSPHGGPAAESLGPEVALGAMSLTAPGDWVRKPVSPGIVLAEFSLPRAEEDAVDGRLTVTSVGASVETIITMWRGQFGGKPEKESRDALEVAGIPITLVDFSGTYGSQQMGPMRAEPRSGYRMRAAVFSIDGKQFIIKAVGPERTLARHAEGFAALVGSLKSGDADSTDADSTGEAAPDADSTEGS